MLVMVNDLIVHEPVINDLAEQLSSTRETVIGQLFTLAWYVNRYSDDDELSMFGSDFIAKIFDYHDADELMDTL